MNLRQEIQALETGLTDAVRAFRRLGANREAEAAAGVLRDLRRRRADETARAAEAAQGGLFEPVPCAVHYRPYVASETSIEAAAATNARRDRDRVLEALRSRPDTDDGLEVRLSLPHQTASARRRGLVLEGLVRESGEHALTRSGRRAIVWEVTSA